MYKKWYKIDIYACHEHGDLHRDEMTPYGV